MVVASSKILRIAYVNMTNFNAATGKTFHQGDVISDADISGATNLNWQQLAVNSPISDLKFVREALTAEQYSQENRDDISMPGFHAPEGKISRKHDASFSTTHKELLQNGLGLFNAKSAETDTVSGDVSYSNIVTISGTGITSASAGKAVKVGKNLAIVTSVTGSTVTLENKLNAEDGDTIEAVDYYNLDGINEERYLLFVETDKDNHVVTWVQFGIDFETPNNELLNILINFQGDMANISTLNWSTIGTVIAETATQHMTTTNFKGLSIVDSDLVCANAFNFKLTREMSRITCQATESQQGNAGTDRKKYTTELTVVAYSSALHADYKANDYIKVLGQKESFMIYAPGALIRSEDTNTIDGNSHVTTYVISANVDSSEKVIIVL